MTFLKNLFADLAIEAAFLSEGALLKLTVETLQWSLIFVLFDFSAFQSESFVLGSVVDILDLEVCYYPTAKAFGSWFSILDVLLVQVDLTWDGTSEFVIKSEDVLEDGEV